MKVDKSELIRKLSGMDVDFVELKKGKISLVFDGKKITDITSKKHNRLIGNWSGKHNEIFYDVNLKKEDVLPVIVHEAVEKYVVERYGLDTDREAHKIATEVEKRFVEEKAWRGHEERVAMAWKKANKRKIGKTKFF